MVYANKTKIGNVLQYSKFPEKFPDDSNVSASLIIVTRENVRDRSEYLLVKALLIEKRQNQARLREIDKLLRDMRVRYPELLEVAMGDVG
jgi:hypothetical protein